MTRNRAIQNIEVIGYQDSADTLFIHYFIKGKEKYLPVDKAEPSDLMEIYNLHDQTLCQHSAIEIAAEHEVTLHTQKIMDMTKPDGLFEAMVSINRMNTTILNPVNA